MTDECRSPGHRRPSDAPGLDLSQSRRAGWPCSGIFPSTQTEKFGLRNKKFGLRILKGIFVAEFAPNSFVYLFELK
jgi:hypothetical protein